MRVIVKRKKIDEVDDKQPKSVVGKYLYSLGKKDMEKERQSGEHKGDCC